MADRPIIFSGPMVRALLEGRKTQTRRALKPPYGTLEYLRDGTWRPICIKFFKGDRLYVREAFSYDRLDVDRDGTLPPWYWADGNPDGGDWTRPKPSIHMPRWASRLTLTVTDVRVQRLQDISEADAVVEGCESDTDGWCDYQSPATQCCATARDSYRTLWNSLHGAEAWAVNPWVVALTFTVQHGNIDRIGGLK